MRDERPNPTPTQHEPTLRAVLALLIHEREERQPPATPPTETILARAGLSTADIAALIGDVPHRPVSVIERAHAYMVRNAA